MKFCLFGDSIAKGVSFDHEKGRYVQMENCFANLFKNKVDCLVENYSRFGSTIEGGNAMLERKWESLSDCDYVVFEFGGNDCNFDWQHVSECPEDENPCAIPMNIFVDTYVSMVNRVKALGKRVVLLTLPPLDSEKYFNWIIKNRSVENILKFIGGSRDFLYRWQERYSDAVRCVAEKTGAVLVDLRDSLLKERNYSRCVCEDGIHPNENGHRIMFNELVGAFDGRK